MMSLLDQMDIKINFLSMSIENINKDSILNILNDEQFTQIGIKGLNLFYLGNLINETNFNNANLENITINIQNFLDLVIELNKDNDITEFEWKILFYFLYGTTIVRNINANFYEEIKTLIDELEELSGKEYSEYNAFWYMQMQLKYILLHLYDIILFKEHTPEIIAKLNNILQSLRTEDIRDNMDDISAKLSRIKFLTH